MMQRIFLLEIFNSNELTKSEKQKFIKQLFPYYYEYDFSSTLMLQITSLINNIVDDELRFVALCALLLHHWQSNSWGFKTDIDAILTCSRLEDEAKLNVIKWLKRQFPDLCNAEITSFLLRNLSENNKKLWVSQIDIPSLVNNVAEFEDFKNLYDSLPDSQNKASLIAATEISKFTTFNTYRNFIFLCESLDDTDKMLFILELDPEKLRSMTDTVYRFIEICKKLKSRNAITLFIETLGSEKLISLIRNISNEITAENFRRIYDCLNDLGMQEIFIYNLGWENVVELCFSYSQIHEILPTLTPNDKKTLLFKLPLKSWEAIALDDKDLTKTFAKANLSADDINIQLLQLEPNFLKKVYTCPATSFYTLFNMVGLKHIDTIINIFQAKECARLLAEGSDCLKIKPFLDTKSIITKRKGALQFIHILKTQYNVNFDNYKQPMMRDLIRQYQKAESLRVGYKKPLGNNRISTKQLGEMFYKYANPGFLSLTSRKHKPLAVKIADWIKMPENNNKSINEYLEFIEKTISGVRHNPAGTFAGLIEITRTLKIELQDAPVVVQNSINF